MKKLFFLSAIILLTGINACYAKKAIKITCDQEDAKIYVDNDYVASGAYLVESKKINGHIRVKIEKPGYITRRFKIKEGDDRKSIDIVLEKDDGYTSSSSNELANKFFAIPVSKKYIEAAGSKDAAAKLAWKQLHQILLNYIEEIEESKDTWEDLSFEDLYKAIEYGKKEAKARNELY